MRDFLGRHVTIGDRIFYSTTGRYPESRVGKISRISEKSIWIKIEKTNRFDTRVGDEVIVRNDFILVTDSF